MSQLVGEIIGHCLKCGKPIGDQNPYAWCIECGEPLTPKIKAKIPLLFQREQQAQEKQQSQQVTEDLLQKKSDDELLTASRRLYLVTEEEEIIIRAQLRRRGLPEPDTTIRTARNKQRNQSLGGSPVLNRYRDLYRVARLLVKIGDTVKVIGIVVGVGILFLSLVAGGAAGSASVVGALGIVGAVYGALIGGFIALLGIIIAAQGQMLLAQADSAVHTSPFMTDEDRAKVMSL